ncbi:MAG: metal-dependent hydrolase [Saprospirales bacterium]|nr:metal-dependent hydrolase [Saprospirales bacterium]
MSTTSTSTTKKTSTSKAYNHEEIKVRRVNFIFNKDNPRFYYKNNPFSTHFINALHIVFPTGERFFVNSVLKHQKEITDDKLKKQVRNFCGQEGVHSAMHEKFWNILKENGYIIKGYENHIDKLLHKIIAKMAELFQWHAAEEIEHKNVAFDVFQKVDKDEHIKRVTLMPIVTALLYFYLGIGTMMLMYQDRKYLKLTKLPKQFYDFATGLFSDLHGDLIKEYFSFFKKDFHPSFLNDYHFAENFFKDKDYA